MGRVFAFAYVCMHVRMCGLVGTGSSDIGGSLGTAMVGVNATARGHRATPSPKQLPIQQGKQRTDSQHNHLQAQSTQTRGHARTRAHNTITRTLTHTRNTRNTRIALSHTEALGRRCAASPDCVVYSMVPKGADRRPFPSRLGRPAEGGWGRGRSGGNRVGGWRMGMAG